MVLQRSKVSSAASLGPPNVTNVHDKQVSASVYTDAVFYMQSSSDCMETFMATISRPCMEHAHHAEAARLFQGPSLAF